MSERKKKWTRNQKLLLIMVIIGAVAAISPYILPFVTQNKVINDKEIEKVVIECLEKHRNKFQDFQQDSEHLKEELRKAIERTKSLASKGNQPDAKKALKELLDNCDLYSIQKLLINERDKYRNALIQRNSEISAVAFLRGDVDVIQNTINQSLAIEPNDPPSLNMKGIVYMMQGKLDEAEETFSYVQDILIKNKNEKWQTVILGNLGIVQLKQGELDKSKVTIEKALRIQENLGDNIGMANSHGNLSFIYSRKGDLNKAEEEIKKSLALLKLPKKTK